MLATLVLRTGVVTGSRDPLGVQQYICCYFNLELDKVTEQFPMCNTLRILRTVPQLCAFRLIVRVSLK